MFIRRCGPRPWISNVNIGSRRGAWGNRVSPCPHPREGLGGRSPPRNNRMFIAVLCGGAAWTSEVTIVRRVQPPSQPPPAGERRRTPSPQRGEGWGGGQSLCPRRRGAGGTPALPGHGHRGGVRHAHDRLTVTMGKPGSPIPPPAGGSGRVKPARSGLGKPGFPILSPGGRVWECQALSGEPSYPIMGGSGRA